MVAPLQSVISRNHSFLRGSNGQALIVTRHTLHPVSTGDGLILGKSATWNVSGPQSLGVSPSFSGYVWRGWTYSNGHITDGSGSSAQGAVTVSTTAGQTRRYTQWFKPNYNGHVWWQAPWADPHFIETYSGASVHVNLIVQVIDASITPTINFNQSLAGGSIVTPDVNGIYGLGLLTAAQAVLLFAYSDNDIGIASGHGARYLLKFPASSGYNGSLLGSI